MALYSSNNQNAGSQQNLSSSYKTLLALTAATATLTSARIYDVLVGTDGTPADNALDWDISRQTAAGTSTATTPNPLDPGSRAAGTVGSANFTAEGTITASSSVFFIGINQRASYRWVAAPGSELIIPATSLAGFALRAKSAGYASTASGTLFHSE
jgi:hypothetical protein